jgi:glycosyltransferase involved in cell wall biosynthesis
MNLIIGHYHLRHGGVRRIIESQIEALKNSIQINEIKVVSGAPPDENTGNNKNRKLIQNPIINPLLMYLDDKINQEDAVSLKNRLFLFFKEITGKNGILHFHNPNLGKNPLVTYALFQMILEGYRVALHCHDFAEDRATNYNFLKKIIKDYFHKDLKTVMYPKNRNCIYFVLNSADKRRLEDYGINQSRISLLPNPISKIDLNGPSASEKAKKTVYSFFQLDPSLPLILYPVRVIRRKNIGELALLASLFQAKAHFMVTRKPKNPKEQTSYYNWKNFIEENRINFIFEAGEQMEFELLMQASGKIITTSIKEGFGMAYLEPWLFHKPVIGRRLPSVVKDFEQKGIVLTHLYDELTVRYNSRQMDFASLSEKDQMDFIKSIIQNYNDKEKIVSTIISYNKLKHVLFSSVPESIIVKNRLLIERNYSIKEYGKKLIQLYEGLYHQS